MKTIVSIFCLLVSVVFVNGQLPDGSEGPDFTVTDINGNEHNLYSYLNQGKTVFIDFSQTWCPICWTYHQTGNLSTLYNLYGPDGTDEVMVLFIEDDPSTSTEDLTVPSASSQGNWVEGTPYPIIEETTLGSDYPFFAKPTIYGIHPDKKTKSFRSSSATVENLYAYVQAYEPADSTAPDTLITYTIDQVKDPSCPGFQDGSINISVNGPGSSYDYLWSNSDTTQDISGLVAANYSCRITDNLGNELFTEPIEITDPDSIAINLLVTTPTSPDTNDGRIVADVQGGTQPYFYTWQDGFTGPVYVDAGEGLYSVEVIDAKGCSLTDSVNIGLPNCSVVLFINEIPSSCETSFDGEVNILVDGAVAPVVYEWSNGDTTQNITNVPPGAYEVLVTDSRGCSATAAGIVSINDERSPTLRAVDFIQIYIQNGKTILTAEMVDNGSTDNCGIVDMRLSQDTFTCAHLGINTVTYTVLDGNLNLSNKLIDVEVLDTTKPYFICPENISVQSCNGIVNYKIPEVVDNCSMGSTLTFSGIGSGKEFPEGTSTETYMYIDNDGNRDTCSFTVTIEQKITVDLVTNDVSCPGASDGFAVANITNTNRQYSFLWSDGQTTPTAINLGAGSYSVTIQDTSECSFHRNFNIGEPTSISVRLDSIAENDDNTGRVFVTIFGGSQPYQYAWKTISGNQLVASTQDPTLNFGDYVLEITDGNGCLNNTFKLRVGTVATIDYNLSNAMHIIPSPNDGNFQINLATHSGGEAQLKISDTYGKTFYSKNIQLADRISVESNHLTPGIYFVQLYTSKGVASKKMIVQ